MIDEEIENWKRRIDAMDQVEMARLWRFSPSGHPIFDDRFPLFEHFNTRFKSLGGMTPGISKQIGWGNGLTTA